MKFSFILCIGKNEIITTGTFTRVYYHRINKLIFLTTKILGYLQFHLFLTKMILYNHMIVNGIFTILTIKSLPPLNNHIYCETLLI